MPVLTRLRALAAGATLAASTIGLVTLNGPGPLPLTGTAARAQGTPGLFEFRWDNNKDFRKLYYFMTETGRLRRAEYYLILKPKDRKTAMLKLSVKLPDYWQADLDPKLIKLCRMKEGGMMSRTRCEEVIPAVIEVAPNGRAIDVFPSTPVPDDKTVGLYMILINPSNAGMYQFNAFIQPPGDIPVSSYVGSWLIQIDPG